MRGGTTLGSYARGMRGRLGGLLFAFTFTTAAIPRAAPVVDGEWYAAENATGLVVAFTEGRGLVECDKEGRPEPL